jgi:4-diphosphocytidyl-2-C-methyl-D-erythritol kinase
MRSLRRLRIDAHAKINLDLRILGKRSDGYHELVTILQAIALHDTVTVESTRGGLELRGDATKMPLDRSNLAWRAAEALWRAAGRAGDPAGARVTIRKRIPAQAGLGGGSSDAAAALIGLDRVWRLRRSAMELLEVAGSLGSDVPFFLVGGTALGLGRGDQLAPVADMPERPVVVAWPDRGVSTADAYSWVTLPKSESVSMLGFFLGRLDQLRNDLEAAVEARRPEVAQIRRALLERGALAARMSGSGSACFGVFGTPGAAARGARALRAAGWHAVATRTIGRRRRARLLAGGSRLV